MSFNWNNILLAQCSNSIAILTGIIPLFPHQLPGMSPLNPLSHHLPLSTWLTARGSFKMQICHFHCQGLHPSTVCRCPLEKIQTLLTQLIGRFGAAPAQPSGRSHLSPLPPFPFGTPGRPELCFFTAPHFLPLQSFCKCSLSSWNLFSPFSTTPSRCSSYVLWKFLTSLAKPEGRYNICFPHHSALPSTTAARDTPIIHICRTGHSSADSREQTAPPVDASWHFST